MAFNSRTGYDCGPLDCTAYEGSRSPAEFAREAARPARLRVAGAAERIVEEALRYRPIAL
ncbi:hypothetical protein ACIQBJ_32775 [Kitasatospora sp. NPDC088391]|uniref:hypothetical protein n=1 Tax=Kitasatospora sp. NPDC088391 TaxID=3364074 RepID=UPI0038178BCE